MAYSLVGSAGAVTVGAAGAAVTPAWDAGASRTANNLLVFLVSGWGGATTPDIPTGWSVAENISTGLGLAGVIFYRIATGSDAAPTAAAATGMTWAAQLLEFSGNATSSPKDHSGGGAADTSPFALANSGTDAAAGDLVVWVSGEGSAVITATMASSPNNGMTANDVTNNSTSTATHYLFGYGITTSNSTAAANSITFDAAAGDFAAGVIASFKVAPLTGTITLSQSLAVSLTLTRPLTGTITLAQSLAGRATLTRPLTGTLRFAQAFARLLQIGSALADGLRLSGPPAPTPTQSNLQGR